MSEVLAGASGSGGDPDDRSSNPAANERFQDVLARRLSRRGVLRGVLRGGTVAAAAGFLGGMEAGPEAGPAAGGGGSHRPLLGFPAVPTSAADGLSVAEGYTAQVLIPWGTPIRSGGPAWKKDASNTAAEQAQQVGMHHDGMHLFPLGRDSGLLVLNHEYTDMVLLYADGDTPMTREKVDKALAAHGVSVVKIARDRAGWRAVDSGFNRRITGNTPMTFSGPVTAGHPALAAAGPIRGTLNNCSSGKTPWGTYLTCEENWNSYFGTQDTTWRATAEQARYGVSAAGFGYRWHTADPRFDVAGNPNELHRFGWVVEIDPFAPSSTPVKRSALGRAKHESATVTESRGRIVVYTGDDQDGEYVYKFVGRDSWRRTRALGRSPLDDGTLYVARFGDDGSGRWLPLRFGTGPN